MNASDSASSALRSSLLCARMVFTSSTTIPEYPLPVLGSRKLADVAADREGVTHPAAVAVA